MFCPFAFLLHRTSGAYCVVLILQQVVCALVFQEEELGFQQHMLM